MGLRDKLGRIFKPKDPRIRRPEESIAIALKKSESATSRLRNNPVSNCHEVWNHYLSEEESTAIHLERIIRYGYSERSGKEERSKLSYIKDLSMNPEKSCHQKFHSYIKLTSRESDAIHEFRFQRYNRSFRSSTHRTLADKNKVAKELERRTKKSKRVDSLIEDPRLNCHEGWHSSVGMTRQESLHIHEERLQIYNQSFRSEYKNQAVAAMAWKKRNLEIIEKYAKGLYLEIESIKKTDSYGIEDFSGWECEYLENWGEDLIIDSITRKKYKNFKKSEGIAYFFERIIACNMGGVKSWFDDCSDFKQHLVKETQKTTNSLDNETWESGSWRSFMLDLTYTIYKKYCDTSEAKLFQDEGEGGQGYVYFIRNDDLYKIGVTIDQARRFRELKPDEILYIIRSKDYLRIEKVLHGLFADVRVHGSEYFRMNKGQVNRVIEYMVELAQ